MMTSKLFMNKLNFNKAMHSMYAGTVERERVVKSIKSKFSRIYSIVAPRVDDERKEKIKTGVGLLFFCLRNQFKVDDGD